MAQHKAILLIDDDEDDQDVFREVLQGINNQVHFMWARNGMDALAVLSKSATKPDVIFLDLNMPQMNGKVCLKHIKSDPSHKDIPVVIYTTSAAPRDVKETMSGGALGFVTKPTEVQRIREILSAVLASPADQLGSVINNFSEK